jgi:hypothetical protein
MAPGFHSRSSGDARIVKTAMDPYAKPNERKVGANRPKISHLPTDLETRTRQQRQAEKQAVAAERRAIKKAARRNLKQELEEEISKLEIRNPKQ